MVTKAVGFMADDSEDDYEDITNNYKSAEGSLSERMSVIRALKQNESTWMTNRYPANQSEDIFFQMTDLHKGTYGQHYIVSLFLHVKFKLFFLEKIFLGKLQLAFS